METLLEAMIQLKESDNIDSVDKTEEVANKLNARADELFGDDEYIRSLVQDNINYVLETESEFFSETDISDDMIDEWFSEVIQIILPTLQDELNEKDCEIERLESIKDEFMAGYDGEDTSDITDKSYQIETDLVKANKEYKELQDKINGLSELSALL